MCAIGFHNCKECGDELSCFLPDEECYTAVTCERCEYWAEELWREEEKRKEDRAAYAEHWSNLSGDPTKW